MHIDRNYVKALVRPYLKNEADIEDVTQDVMLKAYVSRDTFKAGSLVTSWIYVIARNASLDFLRGRVRQSRDLSEAVTHFTPNPAGQLNARHDLARATAAVDAMGSKYPEVFRLRYLQGNTEGEVASAMGLSLATVKIRAHRARLVALKAVSA